MLVTYFSHSLVTCFSHSLVTCWPGNDLYISGIRTHKWAGIDIVTVILKYFLQIYIEITALTRLYHNNQAMRERLLDETLLQINIESSVV